MNETLRSLSDIARHVGVTRQRIQQLKDDLPKPDGFTTTGAQTWRPSTITRWWEKRSHTRGRAVA